MKTPSYIFDQARFTARLKLFADLRQESAFKLLYSIKALPLPAVLQMMLPYVDGFSASSLYEAKLAREVLGESGIVHMTSPGIRPDEIDELAEVCDQISLNSMTQWQRFSSRLASNVKIGLRINPQLSFLDDQRFDPCRPYSKLGVPIDQISDDEIASLKGISGLHFHTMFGSNKLDPLTKTTAKVEARFADLFHQLDWINIGGGYVFEDAKNLAEFEAIISDLSERYQLTIIFEPGKGIIDDAGELITEVIDIFQSSGKNIVVLDSTVGHHPEIFEYQRSPAIKEDNRSGNWSCMLVGASCKSGDLFGEYHFSEPLQIGSCVTLTDIGAYSLVKANRFNGINLPNIVMRLSSGEFQQIKHYNYEDYKDYWFV